MTNAWIVGSTIALTSLVGWMGLLWWHFLTLARRQEAFHAEIDRIVAQIFINEPGLWTTPTRETVGTLTERWTV